MGKLVIMARFVPEMNDIQEMLEKKGIGYAAVRGGVKDRAEEIRRFWKIPTVWFLLDRLRQQG